MDPAQQQIFLGASPFRARIEVSQWGLVRGTLTIDTCLLLPKLALPSTWIVRRQEYACSKDGICLGDEISLHAETLSLVVAAALQLKAEAVQFCMHSAMRCRHHTHHYKHHHNQRSLVQNDASHSCLPLPITQSLFLPPSPPSVSNITDPNLSPIVRRLPVVGTSYVLV
jgi:hypothetical protein